MPNGKPPFDNSPLGSLRAGQLWRRPRHHLVNPVCPDVLQLLNVNSRSIYSTAMPLPECKGSSSVHEGMNREPPALVLVEIYP